MDKFNIVAWTACGLVSWAYVGSRLAVFYSAATWAPFVPKKPQEGPERDPSCDWPDMGESR